MLFQLTHVTPWTLDLLQGGFAADGEGCFTIFLTKNPLSIGWQVRVSFEISLDKKDLILLEEIQSYFGGAGVISSNTSRDTVTYRIQSLEQILNVILPHFDKYRLITQKGADYLLFREVVRMMQLKQHFTFEGTLAQEKIVSIKPSVNWGLSDSLKAAFPNILPMRSKKRVLFENPLIANPHWLAGFTAGEGSFKVRV